MREVQTSNKFSLGRKIARLCYQWKMVSYLLLINSATITGGSRYLQTIDTQPQLNQTKITGRLWMICKQYEMNFFRFETLPQGYIMQITQYYKHWPWTCNTWKFTFFELLFDYNWWQQVFANYWHATIAKSDEAYRGMVYDMQTVWNELFFDTKPYPKGI